MCVIKGWGRGRRRRGGHGYSAQVSARDMQTFCPLTPGTRPCRVGCRAIAPEPQPLSGVSGYLKAAAVRAAATREGDGSACPSCEREGKEMEQSAILATRRHQPIRSIRINHMAATQYIEARCHGEQNLPRFQPCSCAQAFLMSGVNGQKGH